MIKLIATDMDGTLLDGRGEVDLPRLERLLDHLDQKGIRFVIATGNEIHRMRQLLGPLVKRVTLVVANGARIFEDDQMILGKFWDRELVEAVLTYFKGREISDQLVVSAVNGGFAKEGTVFTEVEKFMQPEVIEALYKRMKFVPELTADLFDQVLKMSVSGSPASFWRSADGGFERFWQHGSLTSRHSQGLGSGSINGDVAA